MKVKGTKVKLPIFLPDGTRAVVRSLDSRDLESVGVEGLVVITWHLMSNPGLSVLKKFGGVKPFMNWKRLVVSDSGGFQIFSLIHRHEAKGQVTDKGVRFKIEGHSEELFTPEKSIQAQFAINSDIMICLDDFTPFNASDRKIKESVDRTVLWANRCKAEFEKQIKRRKLTESTRPLLFGVIQGAHNLHARKRCADELIKIGFDGYGLGGWPLTKSGKLDKKVVKFTAECMPDDKPKFALGIGNPESIKACYKMGYNIFDCVVPTRDARHKRLYQLSDSGRVSKLDIRKSKYKKDKSLVFGGYSKAYLHHLFKINDSLAWRIATMHNLRTYTRLIALLRKAPG